MKKKYFGTDGIRGTVGSFPITADFMLKTGGLLELSLKNILKINIGY